MGIGIGMVVTSLLMIAAPKPKISETELVKMARDRGMVFQDDIKALYDKK